MIQISNYFILILFIKRIITMGHIKYKSVHHNVIEMAKIITIQSYIVMKIIAYRKIITYRSRFVSPNAIYVTFTSVCRIIRLYMLTLSLCNVRF